MKSIFFIFLSLLSTLAISKEKSDSTKSPLNISGELTLNSNGIAPVPAFAFGKPTFKSNITLKKNRFSYNSQLSYGLNFKPWIMDNWFHYLLIDNPKFEFRTGLDISVFFSDYQAPDKDIIQGQRYVAFELAGKYIITPRNSISLMAWSDNGIDQGSISGYFIDLVYEHVDIRIGKNLLLDVNVQTFYTDYTGNNDGFFISPQVSLSVRNVPFFIFSQAIQPLTSNISPYPDFQLNIGLGFSF